MKHTVSGLRKMVLSLLIVGLSTGLAGCFDATEVENLNVVAGMGIDLLSDNQVQVTLEIFRPIRSGQSSGADANQRQSFVVSGTGSTIEDALSHFTNKAPRKLYYPHNVLFVFGRKYADQGVDQAFDYLERDRAYRRNELVLIADKSAAEVLQSHFVTPRVTALGVRQLIDELGKQSEVYNTEQLTFLRQYLEPSHTSLASVVSLYNGMPTVPGLALVKQGKLSTIVTGPTLKGLLWTLGETRQLFVTVPMGGPSEEEQKSTIRLIRTYRTIRWHKKGHQMIADITVSGRAEVNHLGGSEKLSQRTMRKLETKTEQFIAKNMRASMQSMQKLNVDGAQMATSLHRSKPAWWKACAPQWDQVFPSIQTNYHVQIKIIRSGLASNPPKGAYSKHGSLPPSE